MQRENILNGWMLSTVCFAICQMVLGYLLVSCSSAAENSDPSKWKPGQVLSEKTINLGNGYKEVHRSVVNPPGHWEGVGHFSYVYFKDKPLCQCSRNEVVISPDGSYAIFAEETDGNLMLLDARNLVSRALTTEFIGLPDSASWDMKGGKVVVSVKKWVSEKKEYEEKKVPVELLAPVK